MKSNSTKWQLWICLLCSICISAQSQIFVSSSAAPGGDGMSWASAFNILQDGIDAANTGDQIWVAQGTYYPTQGFDADDDGVTEVREATFFIDKDLQIYGGLQGDETTLPPADVCNPSEKSILCGDLGDLGDNTDKAVVLRMLKVLMKKGASTSVTTSED